MAKDLDSPVRAVALVLSLLCSARGESYECARPVIEPQRTIAVVK